MEEKLQKNSKKFQMPTLSSATQTKNSSTTAWDKWIIPFQASPVLITVGKVDNNRETSMDFRTPISLGKRPKQRTEPNTRNPHTETNREMSIPSIPLRITKVKTPSRVWETSSITSKGRQTRKPSDGSSNDKVVKTLRNNEWALKNLWLSKELESMSRTRGWDSSNMIIGAMGTQTIQTKTRMGGLVLARKILLILLMKIGHKSRDRILVVPWILPKNS